MKTKTKSRCARGLDPAVFLEAARMIGQDEEPFCCSALTISLGMSWLTDYNAQEVVYLQDVLQPTGSVKTSAWYGTQSLANQTARILGLCLCALLIAEGFDPKES